MALFRKLFYKKPPDGLLEISERVYVFDCCFTTDAWEEQSYKGYAGGIITELREHYPDSSILLFNFREGDTQSMIANALSDYDMTIMEYPRHYEGCPLLPMEVIHHFLRSSESWLSLGLQNLLLMHCERGGWPVLAFMLAALLIYRKQYSGEQKTLEMVYRQAPRELLQFLSPLNPMPSQLRYLQYISRRNVATEWPPLDRALTVDCVIIRMIPNFDGVGGCRPIFRIYGQDPFLVSDRAPKVLFSTPKKSRTVRHYKQAECELVKIDINCHIQGDIVLECISLHDDMEREEMMFRVMFNTAFIRSNILMLNRDEIDISWDAKDRFPKDFRAEVIFSEMDAAKSIVPLDFSFLEEKDGLPVEAFARVQEIFSSVDWAVPKGDAAVEVLQHIAVSSNIVIEAYSHAEKLQEIQNAAAQEYDSKSSSETMSPKSPFSTLNRSTKDTDSDSGRSPEASPSPLTPSLEDKIGFKYKSSLPLLAPETPSDQTPSSNNNIAIGHSISVQSTQIPVECDSVIRQGSPRLALSSSAASSTENLVKAIRFVAPPPPPLPTPTHFSSTVNVSYSTRVEPLLTIKNLLSTPNGAQPSEDGPLQTPPPPDLSSSKEDEPRKLAGPTHTPNKTPPTTPPPPHSHLSSSIEDETRKIAGPTCSPSIETPPPAPPPPRHLSLSIEDETHNISRPTCSPSNRTPPPALPPPPPISSLKEKSAGKDGPSAPAPPPFTPLLIDGSTSRPAASPTPPLPPGVLLLNENLSSSGGSPFPPPPPPPPSVSTLKEDHSAGRDVPPAPLTPPLTDKKTTRPAPPPPPPLPSLSPGDKSSTIGAAPPPPPPPLHPEYGAGSMNPSPASPPPPPPAPANSRSPTTSSPPVPIAPPPPLHSHKDDANSSNSRSSSLSGAPSPPPPSIPPGIKGKSLLSRTVTSRNNQTKKLKPLHWLKLSRAVSGSLWAEAQKSGEASKAPEIDISELESLFSASASNTDQGGSGRKAGSRVSMAHKPEKVQLIEHRRAYNCEIMLSKVKIPLHELLGSVLALEDTALDVDQVENVIKFCPTKEEMELLKGYKGEKDKLGKCEQFFLELMQVPRIESKLRVFSFKIQFSSQVADLRNSLNVVNSAADQIRGSVKLKRIMQTILSLGNALNQGTARGSAVGFKLDSLLKLTETRALNNKMTLMHYLCKVLADKLPELLDFWEDLSSLERSSKIQLKYLAEEMQATNKGLEKVVQELAMSENDGPVSDQFRKALKEFLCLSESEVRSLASLYSGVGRNVDALILYFGEDPARCPFEQVISTLLNFVRMFKKAHEENCKQLEFDKKKAKKEASAEKLKINASDTGNLLQSQVRSVK